MKIFTWVILTSICFYSSIAHAIIFIDNNGIVYQTDQKNNNSGYCETKKRNNQNSYDLKPYKYSLPDIPTTHVKPNGRGGYSWVKPGNPNSGDILDRIPHNIIQ